MYVLHEVHKWWSYGKAACFIYVLFNLLQFFWVVCTKNDWYLLGCDTYNLVNFCWRFGWFTALISRVAFNRKRSWGLTWTARTVIRNTTLNYENQYTSKNGRTHCVNVPNHLIYGVNLQTFYFLHLSILYGAIEAFLWRKTIRRPTKTKNRTELWDHYWTTKSLHPSLTWQFITLLS